MNEKFQDQKKLTVKKKSGEKLMEFAEQMKLAEIIMKENQNVLKKLSKG